MEAVLRLPCQLQMVIPPPLPQPGPGSHCALRGDHGPCFTISEDGKTVVQDKTEDTHPLGWRTVRLYKSIKAGIHSYRIRINKMHYMGIGVSLPGWCNSMTSHHAHTTYHKTRRVREYVNGQ